MTLVLETSHKQNHCGNHKAALNEKESKRMFVTVSCSAVIGDKKFEFTFGIKNSLIATLLSPEPRALWRYKLCDIVQRCHD